MPQRVHTGSAAKLAQAALTFSVVRRILTMAPVDKIPKHTPAFLCSLFAEECGGGGLKLPSVRADGANHDGCIPVSRAMGLKEPG